MELRIISPQEGGFIKEIQWNYEEIKAEIAAKMNDYNTLVFTEETIKEAKSDRANLRKLKEAFEVERKRIKKQCMEPYDRFEKQVKEVTALIDEPIRLIDIQIKEVEEKKKEQKRKEIESIFATVGFQNFVTLDMIFDSKWLNASVSAKKIEEQMQETMYKIGQDVFAIRQLPEFSFEAMEVYKKNLDLGKAIQEGQRLSDIQKRKKEHEEQQRRLQEETQIKKAAQETEVTVSAVGVISEGLIAESAPSQEEVYVIDFRVSGTVHQLSELKKFMVENQIQYGPVPKKGE